jgi:hypothetical protein
MTTKEELRVRLQKLAGKVIASCSTCGGKFYTRELLDYHDRTSGHKADSK